MGKARLVLLLAIGACSNGSTPETQHGSAAGPPADTARVREYEAATAAIVGFLRGNGAFRPELIADSVTLRLPPDAGSRTVTLPRDSLRERGNWVVGSGGTDPVSILPYDRDSPLNLLYGRHSNCFETDLAERSSELARVPHVAVQIRRPDSGSCLTVWNATFVFDSAAPPRLRAVVYEQWEW